MADKKITQLNNITGADLANSDEFVVVDITADETKAITFDELKTAFDTGTGFVRVTGDTMTGALNVESTITADGLTVDGNATISSAAGSLYLEDNNYTAGQKVFGVTSKSGDLFLRSFTDDKLTATNRFGIDHSTGDISFYEDTGTTAKFFWDSSAESLGIGTSSPSATIDVVSSGTNSQSLAEFSSASGLRAKIASDGGDDGYMYLYDANDANTVSFRTDGNHSFINGGGNFGIGTSSPTNVKTQINGSLSSTAGTGHLAFGETSTPFWNWRLNTSTADLILDRSYAGWQSTPVIAFDRSSGSVGIGTTSPSRLLTLSGTASPYIALTSNTTGGSPAIFFGDSEDDNEGRITYSNSQDYMSFSTATAERMRIDSSGNLLVGRTTTPSAANAKIAIGGTGNTAVQLTKNGVIAGRVMAVTTGLAFGVDGADGVTERIRIDSSGNLLVGTTDAAVGVGNTGTGLSFGNSGYAAVSRTGSSSQATLYLNKNTNDGTIVDLRKDGTTVGSIGTKLGGLYIADGGVGLRFDSGGTDDILPSNNTGSAADASINLGSSGARFKDLYLSGGVYLGGTDSANKLDDFETGTWTPAFVNVTAPTYTNQQGRYTKIGRLCYFTVDLAYSALNTADASAMAVTVPFTASNDGLGGLIQLVPTSANTGFIGGATEAVQGTISNAATNFSVQGTNNSSTYDYDSGKFAAAGALHFSGWYEAS